MTIRECYDELGLDFDAVLSRLVNEKLVQKFALKFLDDPSFQNLKDALDSKDVETAFRAAHGAVALTCGSSFYISNTKRRASKSPAFVV